MLSNYAILVSLLTSLAAGDETLGFVYNGFQSANLSLDGVAEFTSNGLLRLTNDTSLQKGHAFYPKPNILQELITWLCFFFLYHLCFRNPPIYLTINRHGIAFVVAPTKGLPDARPSQYLGLFNKKNRGSDSNHVFAVELDTIQSIEFSDINDNHSGVDINDLKSVSSAPASYHDNLTGEFKNLSGKRMQVLVEHNGDYKQINITLAPFNSSMPSTPLCLCHMIFHLFFSNAMNVGFSSSVGTLLTPYYVLGWSFKMNRQLEELALSQLPKLPRLGPNPKSKFLTIGCPVIFVSLTLVAVSGVVYVIRRKRKLYSTLF